MLLIGIGNDSRADDGLGWAFLDSVERSGRFDGEIIYRYQLQVEDAEMLAPCPAVVFVDACKEELPEGFALERCAGEVEHAFTTHYLSPRTVVGLCRELYGGNPEAYVLKIQGREWELGQGLSEEARRNLEAALKMFWGKALVGEGG